MFLFRSASSNHATWSSILVVSGFLDPPLFFLFFFFYYRSKRLSGCFATCNPERLLCNANSLVIPTLSLLREEPRNYHVLCALILSCQIFDIYDNYSAIWLFHVIVIIYFSVYDNSCNYTSKEKRYKFKIQAKIPLFCYFVKSFRS